MPLSRSNKHYKNGYDEKLYESTGDSKDFDVERLTQLGLTERQTKDMYRLLGLAKYEERFVIPTTHKETYLDTYHAQGSARLWWRKLWCEL